MSHGFWRRHVYVLNKLRMVCKAQSAESSERCAAKDIIIPLNSFPFITWMPQQDRWKCTNFSLGWGVGGGGWCRAWIDRLCFSTKMNVNWIKEQHETSALKTVKVSASFVFLMSPCLRPLVLSYFWSEDLQPAVLVLQIYCLIRYNNPASLWWYTLMQFKISL